MRLMTISEAYHYDTDGSVLWQGSDLHNTFHYAGEEFFLKSLFTQLTIPSTYYIGLDNRLTINQSDNSSSISGEPVGNGYARAAINTSSGFGASFSSPKWQVQTVTIFFNSTGSWTTVRNAFLITTAGSGGYLIASVPLQSIRTLTSGQSLSFRFVLQLGGA